jgi:hypothetical protein
MVLCGKTTLIKQISQILCLLPIQNLSAFQRERLIVLFIVKRRRLHK